ncbi:hypothetical protein LEMLEM_LOCUS12064 [Lemmus lemmus]
MVGRQGSSAHHVLPSSRAVGEVSLPSLLWVTSSINLPEDKERSNPLPPCCVSLGYEPSGPDPGPHPCPLPTEVGGPSRAWIKAPDQTCLLGPGQHPLGT